MNKTLLACAPCLLLLWSTFADAAWWNADWTLRRQIAVDAGITGADVKENLVDVPLLVRLHAGNLAGIGQLAAEGEELRFLFGDTTSARYHLEKYDAARGQALVWVRVPQLGPNGAQPLWMYYGNPKAAAASDVGGTYDAAQALVLHFGAGEALARDATAYGNHAKEALATVLPAGWLGDAAAFDGQGRISIDATPSLALDPAKGWTFSAWVKSDAGGTVFEAAADGQSLTLLIDAAGARLRFGAKETPVAALQPGKWQHLAAVVGEGALLLYVDGVEAARVAAEVPAFTPALTIGASFSGALDEVGVATVARGAEWIKFQARSQSPDFAVTDFGAEEKAGAAEGEAGGHFGIIIQNVFGRPDAIVEQVVIGICVLMAAIAFLVMFLKAVQLARSRRATRRFLAAFYAAAEKAGGAFEDFDADAEDYEAAPAFRVHQVGLRELRLRVSPAVGAQFAGLDELAVNAMRARLDAVMVRETQGLNSLLVLLTIAISGGPFIGLLGTVVGVMVTFAAIAATGDVNIAAIAPGMAAALLATVAGLGVAIPSLFGYNYLGARAKDIAADMHVFADEFLALVGEHYGKRT